MNITYDMLLCHRQASGNNNDIKENGLMSDVGTVSPIYSNDDHRLSKWPRGDIPSDYTFVSHFRVSFYIQYAHIARRCSQPHARSTGVEQWVWFVQQSDH